MTLDILQFVDNKGGNAEEIRESQRKRDTPLNSKKVNAVQKEIAAKKKAKESADNLVAQKKELDAQVIAKRQETKEFEQKMRQKAGTVGNLVGKGAPVSLTEVYDNVTLRTWFPAGEEAKPPVRTDIMPHHEVLLRLDAMDLTGQAKVAGHRGYYLTNDGIDLNQALISYKIQPPFMMNKEVMAKTAQLDQFDEELYKVIGSEDEKYLIATSEQPISAFHSDEWFEQPAQQLPIRYAGYSTCFRKEAGSFEKVEQFVITEPEKSWEMFDTMIKYDLEAWFPFQKGYKELVSCSNCTDYRELPPKVTLTLTHIFIESRRLEVRCGIKTKDQARKVYVHMLNGTLCATERALCCLVENHQTPDVRLSPSP
ncbi:Cytosolic seryl-tRNA synthetase [Salix suchowensis]|nr:Cytosolic seryl-tRNA synthetase [Salix suchowensis]